MEKYKKRIADALLAEKLSYMGAVLVQGPKWCGKTTTSRQAVKSEVSLEDSVKGKSNRLLAQTRPDKLLEGAIPRLIDEWQEGPQLWDAVRSAVDHGGRGNIWFSNSGWSGASAEQGLWSIEDDIVAKKPTVVTVMFGMMTKCLKMCSLTVCEAFENVQFAYSRSV